MTYEYRVIRPSIEEPIFSQFDLYFYKSKCPSIGVKSRFCQKDRNLLIWHCDNLQCKFINNFHRIKQGQQHLQKWKKLTISADFNVYSLEYIRSHQQQFQSYQNQTLSSIINSQKNRLNKKLIGYLKQMPIKQKHFKRNEELQLWFQLKNPIEEVFIVDKLRKKLYDGENGVFKAIPIYKSQLKSSGKVFKTQSNQSHEEKKLKKIIQKNGLQARPNISYPKFLQLIFIGQL